MGQAGQVASRSRVLFLRLRTDKILRNSAVYLVGGLAAGVLGYVFHFATGRLLGPADYAIVASILAALYIITLPAVVVQTVSARFVSLAAGRGHFGSIPRLLLRVNGGTLAVGGTCALILALLAPLLAGYLRISDVRLVYVLALTSFVALPVTANRGALQGLLRFWALSGNTVLDMAVRVVVAAVLISAGLGVVGAIIALFAGPVTAYAQGLYLLRRYGGADAQKGPSFAEVGRYAIVATIGAAGVTYLFNADVILAKHYLSAEAAGTYAAASVLARVVYFLGTAVAAVMFPEVTTLHARDQTHFHVVDRALLLLGIVAVGLILAYLAVPELVLLPYGHSFDRVRSLLAPFAVALSLVAFTNLLVNYFLSVNRRRFVVPLLAGCALETGLIVAFHDGPLQIVTMVLLALAALTAVLAGLYLTDRLRTVGAVR